MRIRTKTFFLLGCSVFWLTMLAACAGFDPQPMDRIPFMDRAQTRIKENVRVTAAVLSPGESEAAFGVPLYTRGIQPVWLEIENRDGEALWFSHVGLDPNYFPPHEVAYRHHASFSKSRNQRMDRHFHKLAIGSYIPPGTIRSGFVFTHLDLGTKNFNVDLIGEDHQIRAFTFFINVPGLRVDHHEVDWDSLYSKKERVSYGKINLREALGRLPCCTTDSTGKREGDPLNLVIIGWTEDVYHALIRAGWNETGTLNQTDFSMTETLSGVWRQYRYEPVNPLYLYGRPQDAAFRKNRETTHERNELRLWLSPMSFEGKPVWVGEINRDIGLRIAGRSIAYKVEPDMDEARTYFLQTLWFAQRLEKFAYVKGVGAAPMSEPRKNIRGDAFFTDGHRLVLWVSHEPVSFSEVEFEEWEIPPMR